MTFTEIEAEVFRRLQESSSAPVFWTADDVDQAVLDGYTELSDATEWHERYSIVTLLANQPYYDLRTLLQPHMVLSLGAAFNESTNRWLIPTRVSDLDTSNLRWENRTGMPDRLIMRSPWFMGYWPVSTSAGTTIKQHYTALPIDPSEDATSAVWAGIASTSPGFYPELHYGLVEYALADLWAQDGETAKALEAWNTYLQYEAGVKAMIDGRASVPLVHGDVH